MAPPSSMIRAPCPPARAETRSPGRKTSIWPAVKVWPATVTSPEFLLGTRVMLDSFLAENPWFEGEIVVIHDRLDEAQARHRPNP